MKRVGIITVGLTATLVVVAALHFNSAEDTLSIGVNTNPPVSPVTNIETPVRDRMAAPIKPVEEESYKGVPFSELPEDVKWVLKNDTKSLSEKIDGIVKSSEDSSAERKKYLEEIGLRDEFIYLRNHIEDYSAYYNTDVVGEGEAQRKSVRNALRDKLAIFVTSRGLDQARVESLESVGYNVVEGGERAIAFRGDVKDSIALSEDAKFSLDENGSECLFFTSSHLKRFREKVYGSGSEASFSPYCDYGNGYVPTITSTSSEQAYNKSELDDLINKFNN